MKLNLSSRIALAALAVVGSIGMAQGQTNPAGQCMFADLDVFNNDNLVRYFDCGNDASLNLGGNATLEVWARFNNENSTSFDQKIFGKTNPNFNSGYILAMDQGRVYPELWTPARFWAQDGFLSPIPVWYHLAVSYAQGDSMRVYLNGIQVGAQAVPNLSIAANTDPLIIGIAPWDQQSFMTFAEYDEIRIWNVTKTTAEIRQSMHVPLTGNEAGLVAYYDFNQTSGNALPDLSPNGNDGVGVNVDDSNWLPSKAVLGDETLRDMDNIEGIWTSKGFSNPRFVISDQGLSMSGNLTDLDYAVYGHNGNSGISTTELPSNAPMGFERMDRNWYVVPNGAVTMNLTFDIEQGANGGQEITDQESTPNYTLLYRSGTTGAFSAVAPAVNLTNKKVTFNNIILQKGYYTIGVGDMQLTTSVEGVSIDPSSMEIYPNPGNGQFTLRMERGISDDAVLQVYDLAGKMVYNSSVGTSAGSTQIQLDLSGLNKGHYRVQLTNSQATFRQALVIQ